MGIIRENILNFKRGNNSKELLSVGDFREIKNPKIEDILRLTPGDYFFTSVASPFYTIGRVFHNQDQTLTIVLDNRWASTKKISLKRWMGIDRDIKKSLYTSSYVYSRKKSFSLYGKKNQDLDFHDFVEDYGVESIQKIDIHESMEFKRFNDSKKSLGIGIKEINRDLQKMAQNFKEHFADLEFIERSGFIRRREIISNKIMRKTDLLPIDFLIKVNASVGTKQKMQRLSQGKFKGWIFKNTPFILKASKSGIVTLDSKSPTNYGYYHRLYLDDKE